MTNSELNRDVKRLKNLINKTSEKMCMGTNDNTPYFDWLNTFVLKEFKRLYYADDKFEAMNKANILFMLRLNLRHRFIALHQFGINIDID